MLISVLANKLAAHGDLPFLFEFDITDLLYSLILLLRKLRVWVGCIKSRIINLALKVL